MKSFPKYKFILFMCVIVFLFQTGCTDASSISVTDSDTTQENTQDTEMDLTQIQAGDYSSLLGTWKEVAYADNRFDGTGQQWYVGGSGPRSATLSVYSCIFTTTYDGRTVIWGQEEFETGEQVVLTVI